MDLRQQRERDDPPRREYAEERVLHEPEPPHAPVAELEARHRGKTGGERETDRRRKREADIARLQEHARRRKRVEPEEARGREEHERYEVHPGVGSEARRGARGIRKGRGDRACGEDEPE